MYKISVTTLEKFRRFMADTSSYDTEEALRESLEGKFLGNDKTKTGSAFHKIIETTYENPIVSRSDKKGITQQYMVSENIAFPIECAQKAILYRQSHPTMVCEVPVKKEYQLKKHRLQVTGRIDSVIGMQMRDAKTKYSSPSDMSAYVDSCQWKFYCDIIGLKVFHYDIFEVKRFKELTPATDGICYLEGIDIVAHEPITCYAYKAMGEHLNYIMEEFMQYIEFRNLFHLLKTVDHAQAA